MPDWAARYVAYAYEKGYSNGIGGNSRRWDETLFDVVVVDIESGDTVGDKDCPLVSYPLIEKTVVNHYEGQTAPQMTTAKSLTYGSYRNVTSYINWGDTNRNGDELRADIIYETGRPHNQVSLRKSVTVRGGRLPSSPVMRKAEFTYDLQGGLATRFDYTDMTNFAETDYERDVYGNVRVLTLPVNAASQRLSYTYTYDPVLHCLPINTTDSYGRASSSTYSYRHGRPLTVTDAAGNMMRYTYDIMGRVATVTAPRELDAGIPYTWKAEYHDAYGTKTFHYDTLNPGDPIETVTLCDPWGRIVQVKRDISENGTDRMQVSGKVQYDALGRAVRQHDPLSCGSDSILLYRRSPSALRTETAYDILDRTVSCSTWHNASPLVQLTAYAYISTSDGTMLQTSVTDPLLRTTKGISDAYGRNKSVTDANGGTTTFIYDALGQMLSSTDPGGSVTRYQYDMLGRPTQRIHPDAGTTTTVYDPAGNVVSQTNAEGETVSYEYHFMRPTKRHYSKYPMNEVTYTYDPTTGQLTGIRDGSGSQQFRYDALGNVSGNVRTFAVPFSGHTYTFAMDFEYDSWGRMLGMTYPDGEAVTYGYDHGGSLYSMSGMKGGTPYSYIGKVHYDLFGNRKRIEYGDFSHTEYRYDDLQRLKNLTTYAYNSGSETVIQDIDYTFDEVGNILTADNNALAFGALGGPYNNKYVYDNIDRLTGATQNYGSGNDLEASYSPSGRLCSRVQTFTGQDALFGYMKDQPHAPRRILDNGHMALHDLLWDRNGNMAQANVYDIPDGTLQGSRYMYWTEDSRLAGVVDDKHFSYYAYDHGGERVLKMTGDNTLIDVNADYARYSSLVENVTLYTSPYLVASNNGYTKHYYAGTERVCARLGNGNLDNGGSLIGNNDTFGTVATNLFSDLLRSMEHRPLGGNSPQSVTVPCGSTPEYMVKPVEAAVTDVRVEATVITDFFHDAMTTFATMTQQIEDAYFYHGDHLGSASWITDDYGVPVQHLQYLPFGEPFVSQHSTIPPIYTERFMFTGKERDTETGYSYFGARYYDSDLSGLFLSVDPMADKYPSISPYAYCAWNPINLTDPTGDTINVSRLSSTALEKYNADIQELQKSPLFSSYYTDLQNSQNTYFIEEGAGKGGSGSFETSRSTVSAKLDDLYTLSQELFHAFQTDCNIYNSDDASVRETEGDIVAQLVMFDLSKISISESWSSQLYNYVDDYAGMLTPQFSKDFSNMVDLRIDFYKQRELQDDAKAPRSYIQTNSGKPPLALQRAIRKSIQQQ